MAWQQVTKYEAPTMRTFAQALAHYESVPPIRGKGCNAGLVPVGKRNKSYAQMLRKENSVVMHLYSTDVLTYNPDDTIDIFINTWATHSTSQFIAECLGVGTCIFDGRMWLFSDGERFLIPHREKLRIKFDGGKLVVMNPEPIVVHKFNRKAANSVRRQYAPLFQTIDRIFKLRNKEGAGRYKFEEAEFNEALDSFNKADVPMNMPDTWYKPSQKYESFVRLVQAEDYFKAAMWAINRAGWMIYNIRLVGASSNSGFKYFGCRALPKEVKDEVELALFKYHRDEVFDAIPIGNDEWVRDRNKKYFL